MKRQNKLVTYTLLSLIPFLSFQIQPISSPAAPTNTNPRKWFKKPQYYGALGLLLASGVNIAHLLSSAKGRRSVKALFQKENGRWKGFKKKAAQLALLRLGLSTAAAAGGFILGGYTYASGKKTDRPQSQTNRSAQKSSAVTNPAPVIGPIQLIHVTPVIVHAAAEDHTSIATSLQQLTEAPPPPPSRQNSTEIGVATQAIQRAASILTLSHQLLQVTPIAEWEQKQSLISTSIRQSTDINLWNLICTNPDQTLQAYIHNMQLLHAIAKLLQQRSLTLFLPQLNTMQSTITRIRAYYNGSYSCENAQKLLSEIKRITPLYPLFADTKIEGTKRLTDLLSEMLNWINQTLQADDATHRELLSTVASALNALTPLNLTQATNHV
jgi:hypothetical protein